MKIISCNNIYYKISFSILFPEQDIIFIDYKNLNDYNFEENEIIVLGCDDVLNKEYVLYTYEKFVGLNNKIIVICDKITCIDYNPEYLKIFSNIYLSTYEDIECLSNFYPIRNIHYIPNILISLIYKESSFFNNIQLNMYNLMNTFIPINKSICICVSNTTNKNYLSLSRIITYYIKYGYRITLLPLFQEDIHIQNIIYDLIVDSKLRYINNIQKVNNIKIINYIIKNNSILISMNYISSMFAICNSIPFISILNCKNIQNLEWKYVNYDNNINIDNVIQIINNCLSSYHINVFNLSNFLKIEYDKYLLMQKYLKDNHLNNDYSLILKELSNDVKNIKTEFLKFRGEFEPYL